MEKGTNGFAAGSEDRVGHPPSSAGEKSDEREQARKEIMESLGETDHEQATVAAPGLGVADIGNAQKYKALFYLVAGLALFLLGSGDLINHDTSIGVSFSIGLMVASVVLVLLGALAALRIDSRLP